MPVIATPSKRMSTGVDAQLCKLIVLDQNIQSMTLFKQIIGRGTRLREDLGKTWFTILDFKRATELFADKGFDGEPVQIYEPQPGQPPRACATTPASISPSNTTRWTNFFKPGARRTARPPCCKSWKGKAC